MRIIGLAPLEATVSEMERLRCKGSGQLFTAAQPEGMGPEKGGATTSAMIAQLRYGSAVPFKRLERLQANQGIPLLAATQWELIEEAAKPLQAAFNELVRQAAWGEVKHPVENLAEVLKHRVEGLECAHSDVQCPVAQGGKILLTNCMAHGRRHSVDVGPNPPAYVAVKNGATAEALSRRSRRRRCSAASRTVPLLFNPRPWPLAAFALAWAAAHTAIHVADEAWPRRGTNAVSHRPRWLGSCDRT